MDSKYIILESNDHHEYILERKVVIVSSKLRDILRQPQHWLNKHEIPKIKLDINKNLLEKIIDYFEYKYKYENSTNNFHIKLPEYDVKDIIPLLELANDLDI